MGGRSRRIISQTGSYTADGLWLRGSHLCLIPNQQGETYMARRATPASASRTGSPQRRAATQTAALIDIGIDARARQQIAAGLAKVLADTYSLYLKTHAFHWNVEG